MSEAYTPSREHLANEVEYAAWRRNGLVYIALAIIAAALFAIGGFDAPVVMTARIALLAVVVTGIFAILAHRRYRRLNRALQATPWVPNTYRRIRAHRADTTPSV
jgi:uncharacterized membrane protein YidH (DUF202 family)